MFCEASIRDWTGRAVRMLAATPELASYNFATAVILGDADQVRAEIARDPGLATRVDARTGWTPLHAACASQWNQFDPARIDGLLAVARLLLDGGADPVGRSGGPRGRGGWTPLRCAVAGATNPPVVALLLERGAVPDDHDLYLAGFGGTSTRACADAGPRHRRGPMAEMALAAPIAKTTPRGCGCCSRPEPIPAATPTTTVRPRRRPTMPCSPLFGRTARPAARPRRRARPPRPGGPLAVHPGQDPGPRRPGGPAAPIRRRRRHLRHRPVPGRPASTPTRPP